MMREVYKVANILVCDDDKDIVEAISIYLEQEGYVIFKVYDGLEAINILRSQPVDLLIIDIMMPVSYTHLPHIHCQKYLLPLPPDPDSAH